MSGGLRILYVVDSLNVGGAELLVQGMLRTYARRGHRSTVAYFTHGPLYDELVAEGVEVVRLSRFGLADPRALFRLLALIGRGRFDVVHTHLRKSDLLGLPAATLARVPARVSTAHNVDPWRRRRILTGVHRLLTAGCRKVIAVSRQVEEYLIATRTFPASRIVTIENGIDLERFDPERVSPVDRTAEWGLEADTVAIGVIGRLEPQKGHEVLLEAATRMVRERPEVRFVLVGDGSLRAQLEARCAALGLDRHVILAGLSRDVPATLAALDLVTFPSLWEGLPLTLMEAMAMGRPVVATTVGGIPALLDEGRTGVMVPPGDAEALADALLRVVEDPRLASRLGRSAAAEARSRFDIRVMYDRILDVYRQCLEGPCAS